jgi:hypothetical protein
MRRALSQETLGASHYSSSSICISPIMAMNIFQLPSAPLANLVRRTLLTDTTTQPPPTHGLNYSDGTGETRTGATLGAGLKGIGCTICNASSFADVVEQRAHYRSDWHRYNVKAKLMNKLLLGEKEFMGAVAGE